MIDDTSWEYKYVGNRVSDRLQSVGGCFWNCRFVLYGVAGAIDHATEPQRVSRSLQSATTDLEYSHLEGRQW
jgi:hypothetical protein